eukprot:gnl/Chilomastix_cuspidata/1726.p1 GENE.gnl/Chilomastix_cuspidata/1726~~gnl/Chilomastix_cuspidata/1726.p1  ORF type:complete len:4840 (+),score=1675.61 gnl/Chilomastix_cuspidata/1726:186-14522(+)
MFTNVFHVVFVNYDCDGYESLDTFSDFAPKTLSSNLPFFSAFKTPSFYRACYSDQLGAAAWESSQGTDQFETDYYVDTLQTQGSSNFIEYSISISEPSDSYSSGPERSSRSDTSDIRAVSSPTDKTVEPSTRDGGRSPSHSAAYSSPNSSPEQSIRDPETSVSSERSDAAAREEPGAAARDDMPPPPNVDLARIAPQATAEAPSATADERIPKNSEGDPEEPSAAGTQATTAIAGAEDAPSASAQPNAPPRKKKKKKKHAMIPQPPVRPMFWSFTQHFRVNFPDLNPANSVRFMPGLPSRADLNAPDKWVAIAIGVEGEDEQARRHSLKHRLPGSQELFDLEPVEAGNVFAGHFVVDRRVAWLPRMMYQWGRVSVKRSPVEFTTEENLRVYFLAKHTSEGSRLDEWSTRLFDMFCSFLEFIKSDSRSHALLADQVFCGRLAQRVFDNMLRLTGARNTGPENKLRIFDFIQRQFLREKKSFATTRFFFFLLFEYFERHELPRRLSDEEENRLLYRLLDACHKDSLLLEKTREFTELMLRRVFQSYIRRGNLWNAMSLVDHFCKVTKENPIIFFAHHVASETPWLAGCDAGLRLSNKNMNIFLTKIRKSLKWITDKYPTMLELNKTQFLSLLRFCLQFSHVENTLNVLKCFSAFDIAPDTGVLSSLGVGLLLHLLERGCVDAPSTIEIISCHYTESRISFKPELCTFLMSKMDLEVAKTLYVSLVLSAAASPQANLELFLQLFEPLVGFLSRCRGERDVDTVKAVIVEYFGDCSSLLSLFQKADVPLMLTPNFLPFLNQWVVSRYFPLYSMLDLLDDFEFDAALPLQPHMTPLLEIVCEHFSAQITAFNASETAEFLEKVCGVEVYHTPKPAPKFFLDNFFFPRIQGLFEQSFSKLTAGAAPFADLDLRLMFEFETLSQYPHAEQLCQDSTGADTFYGLMVAYCATSVAKLKSLNVGVAHAKRIIKEHLMFRFPLPRFGVRDPEALHRAFEKLTNTHEIRRILLGSIFKVLRQRGFEEIGAYINEVSMLNKPSFLLSCIQRRDYGRLSKFLHKGMEKLYGYQNTFFFKTLLLRTEEFIARQCVGQAGSPSRLGDLIAKVVSELPRRLAAISASVRSEKMLLGTFLMYFGGNSAPDADVIVEQDKEFGRTIKSMHRLTDMRDDFTMLHGLIHSFGYKFAEVMPPDEIFRESMELASFKKKALQQEHFLKKLRHFKDVRDIVAPFSRSFNLLNFVFEKMEPDFDVSVMCTSLQYDDRISTNSGAAVGLREIRKIIEPLKNFRKKRETFESFWNKFYAWARDVLADPKWRHNRKRLCETFAVTIDNAADLVRLYNGITKHIIELNYEKIRKSIELGATFSVAPSGAFEILTKPGDDGKKEIYKDEELEQLRQSCLLVASDTDRETQKKNQLFDTYVTGITQIAALVREIHSTGYLALDKNFSRQNGGVFERPVGEINAISRQLEGELASWMAYRNAMFEQKPILSIIPPSELSTLVRLHQGAAPDTQLSHLFRSLGLDLAEFVTFFRENKQIDPDSNENLLVIGEMLEEFMKGKEESIQHSRVEIPEAFKRLIAQHCTARAVDLFVSGVTIARVPPARVPRMVHVAMGFTGATPLLHEVFFCDKTSQKKVLENFFIMAKNVYFSKGSERTLYYLVEPDNLPLELLQFAQDEVRGIKKVQNARLFVVTSTRESETTIKPFSESVECSAQISPAVVESPLFSEPLQVGLPLWPHDALHFIRGDFPGAGKSTEAQRLLGPLRVEKIIITSEDTCSDVVRHLQRMKLEDGAQYGIHFIISLFPGTACHWIPFFFQILHMRSLNMDGLFFHFSPQISKVVFEHREGSWGLPDLLDRPSTNICFSPRRIRFSDRYIDAFSQFLEDQHKLAHRRELRPPPFDTSRKHVEKSVFRIIESKHRRLRGYRTFEVFAELVCKIQNNISIAKDLTFDPEDRRQTQDQVLENRLTVMTALLDMVARCSFPPTPLSTSERISSKSSVEELIREQTELLASTSLQDDQVIVWASSDGKLSVPFFRKGTVVPSTLMLLYRPREAAIHRRRAPSTSVNEMSSAELARMVTRAVGHEDAFFSGGAPSPAMQTVLSNYCFTQDNTFKMLNIFVRLQSNCPVVLIGESGIGKTELLRTLALLSGIDLYVIQVHAGTGARELEEKISSFIAAAKKAPSWLFFDEANTTPDIFKIESAIFERVIGHTDIPDNFNFIVAANPYRRLSAAERDLFKEYKKPKAKESQYAYTVFPLPQSLLSIAFDLGALATETFTQYARKILKQLFNKDNFPSKIRPFRKPLKRTVLEAIVYSQGISKELGLGFSLREVKRFEKLFLWFMTTHRSAAEPRMVFKQFVYSFVLGISFVYYYRLPTPELRRRYSSAVQAMYRALMQECEAQIGRPKEASEASDDLSFSFDDLIEDQDDVPARDTHLEENYNDMKKLDSDDIIRAIFFEEANAYAKHFINLPPGIAMNMSLTENLFFMLVCIFNRLPLFIIGKPGTSKTLSAALISTKLKGKESDNAFLRTLPRVDITTYQGSSSSTSEGITMAYEQLLAMSDEQRKFEKSGKQKIFSVFQFDEIGLAEHTGQRNALKTLHSILEPERAQDGSKIAFIGITNYSIDYAKLSRAVILVKPDPDEDDLITTADKIFSSFHTEEAARGAFSLKEALPEITRGYTSLIQAQRAQDSACAVFGLRNYYTLVKDLAAERLPASPTQADVSKRISLLIRKNFEDVFTDPEVMPNPFDIFNDTLQMGVETIDSSDKHFMIQRNIGDPNSRHLLLLCDGDYGIFKVIEICEELRRARPRVMYQTGLPLDLQESDRYTMNLLRKLIFIMDPSFDNDQALKGQTVVLRGVEEIYSSMFALLNQHYEQIAQEKSVRIAIGRKSNPLCKVADNFRVVTILYSDELPSTDSAFLNRFEIRNLTMATLLGARPPRVRQEFAKLEARLRQFFEETNEPDICKVIPPFYWAQRRGLAADALVGDQNPTVVSSIVNFEEGENLEEDAFARLMMLVNPNYRFKFRQAFGPEYDARFPGSVSTINLKEALASIQAESDALVHVFLLDRPIGMATVELMRPRELSVVDCSSLVGVCSTNSFIEQLKQKIQERKTQDSLFVFNLFEYKRSPVLINQLVFLIGEATSACAPVSGRPRFVILLSPPEELEALKEFWSNVRLTFVPTVRWAQLLTVPSDDPILRLVGLGKRWSEEIITPQMSKELVHHFQVDALFYAGYNTVPKSLRKDFVERISQYSQSVPFCECVINHVFRARAKLDKEIVYTKKRLLEMNLSSTVRKALTQIENTLLVQFAAYFRHLYNTRTDIGGLDSYSSALLIGKLQNESILKNLASFEPPASYARGRLTEFPLFLFHLEQINKGLRFDESELTRYRAYGEIEEIMQLVAGWSTKDIAFCPSEGLEASYFNYCYLQDECDMPLPVLRDKPVSICLSFLDIFSDLLMFCLGVSVQESPVVLVLLSHILESDVQGEFLFRPFFELFCSLNSLIFALELYTRPGLLRLLAPAAGGARADRLKLVFVNLLGYIFDNQLLVTARIGDQLRTVRKAWRRYHRRCDALVEEELVFCKIDILCRSTDKLQMREYRSIAHKVSRALAPGALWDLRRFDKSNVAFIEELMMSVLGFVQRQLRSDTQSEFTFSKIIQYVLTKLSDNLKTHLKLLYTRQARLVLATIFDQVSLSDIVTSAPMSLHDRVAVEDLDNFFKTARYKDEIVLAVIDALEACHMRFDARRLTFDNLRPIVAALLGPMFTDPQIASAYYKRHIFDVLWVRLLCRYAAYGNSSPNVAATGNALTTLSQLLPKASLMKSTDSDGYRVFIVFARFVLADKRVQGSLDNFEEWLRGLHVGSVRRLKDLKLTDPSKEVMEKISYNPFNIKGRVSKSVAKQLKAARDWEFDESLANALLLTSRFANVVSSTASEEYRDEYARSTAHLRDSQKDTPFSHVFAAMATYRGLNTGEQVLAVSDTDVDIIETNMFLLATGAEAAAKVTPGSFLNHIWPHHRNTPDISSVYIPCGPPSDEVDMLRVFGEEKIRGFVLCKECMSMIMLIDNNCGMPNPPNGPFTRTCNCRGKTITISYHKAQPASVIAVSNQYEPKKFRQELQAYKAHHRPKKGFAFFPDGTPSSLKTYSTRILSPKEYWVSAAIIYACLCMSFPKKVAPKRTMLQEKLRKAFEVLCCLYDKPLSEVFAFLHAVRPAVLDVFAGATTLNTLEQRDTCEGQLKAVLRPFVNKFNETVTKFKMANKVDEGLGTNHITQEVEYMLSHVPFHRQLLRRTPLYAVSDLFGHDGMLGPELKELAPEQKGRLKWLTFLNMEWHLVRPLHNFFSYMEACKCTKNILATSSVPAGDFRVMSIAQFCEAKRKSKDAQVQRYLAALVQHTKGAIAFWNALPEILNLQVAGNECGDDLPRETLTPDSPIRFFFPSSANEGDNHALPGRFARAAIKLMAETQNRVIGVFCTEHGLDEERFPLATVGNATRSCFGTLPGERDILSCAFAEFVPFSSSNVQFDLHTLQDLLARSLVFGRARFDEDNIPDNKQIGTADLCQVISELEDTFWAPEGTTLPDIAPELLSDPYALYNAATRLVQRVHMLPWRRFDTERPIGSYPILMSVIPADLRGFFGRAPLIGLVGLYDRVEGACADKIIRRRCPKLFRASVPDEALRHIKGILRDRRFPRSLMHEEIEMVTQLLTRALLRLFIPKHDISLTSDNEFRKWNDVKGNLEMFLNGMYPVDSDYDEFIEERMDEDTETPLVDAMKELNLRIYHAYGLRRKLMQWHRPRR